MIKFSFEEMEEKMGVKSFYTLLFVLILINLFFIQGLRAFLPGVYVSATHLVWGEDVVINSLILITFVFFLLPAFTNKICKKFGRRRVMISSIYIIVLLRIFTAFHSLSIIEIVCSGLIIPFYGFFLSTFLSLWAEQDDKIELSHKLIVVIFSIYCAFLFDYFFRTIGFTQDIAIITPGFGGDWRITQYFWLLIDIPLSILIIYLTKKYFPRFIAPPKKILFIGEPKQVKTFSKLYSLIFVGVGMFLFLQFNLFLYPNAIAQFTATNYYINNIINLASITIVICIVLFTNTDKISNLKTIGFSNGLMIGSLILFFFFGKILTYIVIILISISLIVMYLNLYFLMFLLSKINCQKWDKLKTISISLTISLLFMLLFSILHILSTEWAFTIQIFKGIGPYIMIIASIIFSITTYLSIKIKSQIEGTEI